MTNELKYNGYSAEPSDYECADGDLATSIGLIQEEGAVKPLFPPSVVHSFEKGLTVKYIHETVNFRHYILYHESGVMSWSWWGESNIKYKQLYDFSSTTIHEVNSVGNTLIVLAADGMHYFLWKNNAYSYLGTEIPELPLSFGLQGEVIQSKGYYSILFTNEIPADKIYNDFDEDTKKEVTEQVLAKVNKFIADNSTSAGKFMYPFLLRYAYRLYDGSLTKHSAPILMIASSDIPVFATILSFSEIGDPMISGFDYLLFGVSHKIDYAAMSQVDIDTLQTWKDIIKSVDVFISAPIFTYDQNGECKRLIEDTPDNSYCVCKHINQKTNENILPIRYQYNTFRRLINNTNNNSLVSTWRSIELPKRSEDVVKSDIKDCNLFYLLDNIKLDQLSLERKVIEVKKDYLQSLVTREVMTDDYDSHDKLIPNYSFTYNNRLNIANLNKVLFKGFSASSMFIYSNGYVTEAGQTNENRVPVSVYFYINQDGKEIITKGDLGYFGVNMPLLYLFFPNTNAYKAVIERIQFTETSSKIVRYEVNLEKHNFLNGSFYFGGWEDVKTTTTTIPAISTDRTISLPNKIYTSEVSNPFYFPVLGINTVGTGDILGISTAAKALSEGQFGQFPLYAFTSEGVWALEVSSTGTYSTKQPITRDVVLGKNSITQIDSAVLFATDRGIMLLSGSNVQCISDVLNSDEMWNISKLPNAHNLITLYNGKVDDNGQQKQITEDDIAFLPFRDFVKECSMIYDYVNQRIIVYNPKESYAYVYSFKSQNWGMMFSGIASNVNSYPEALANTKDNKLVNFSVPGTQVTTSLLITRPFTLNDANGFKTIDSIIQRGMFKSNHVQQVLYGSNDLENWHTVWSSVDRIMRGFRGTPYKAFRLALICSLEKGESIYGCSISYQQRLANKLR